MLEFLFNYGLIILFAILMLFVMVWLIKRGQINKLKSMVLAMVYDAEDHFGGGTGKLKKADVMAYIYSMIPTIAQILLTENELSKIIEDGKLELDDYLATNEKAADLIAKDVELHPPNDGTI